jgi:hypothetical protein
MPLSVRGHANERALGDAAACAGSDPFAVMRNDARSYILELDGGWREIKSTLPPPAENYYGFDIFLGGGQVTMALATDTEVWVSPDDGDTWFRSVADLPRVPHCADLRFGKLEGSDMLFLGTFGRSMWMIGVQNLWDRRDRRDTTGRHRKFFPSPAGSAPLEASGASKKDQPRGGRKKAPRPSKKKANRAGTKIR